MDAERFSAQTPITMAINPFEALRPIDETDQVTVSWNGSQLFMHDDNNPDRNKLAAIAVDSPTAQHLAHLIAERTKLAAALRDASSRVDGLWRVGNHQARNIYEGDRYAGVMFDEPTAESAVNALNAAQRHGMDALDKNAAIRRLTRERDDARAAGESFRQHRESVIAENDVLRQEIKRLADNRDDLRQRAAKTEEDRSERTWN